MNRCICLLPCRSCFASRSPVSRPASPPISSRLRFTLEPRRGSEPDPGQLPPRRPWPQSQHLVDRFRAVRSGRARRRGASAPPAPGRFAFAVDREAGRLDCAGQRRQFLRVGQLPLHRRIRLRISCLPAAGSGARSTDDAFALMAVNVRRELIDALAAGALSDAVGRQSGRADRGRRHRRLYPRLRAPATGPNRSTIWSNSRRSNITPQWIAGFARIGYTQPARRRTGAAQGAEHHARIFAGFERAGYRNLPVDTAGPAEGARHHARFVRRGRGHGGRTAVGRASWSSCGHRSTAPCR